MAHQKTVEKKVTLIKLSTSGSCVGVDSVLAPSAV